MVVCSYHPSYERKANKRFVVSETLFRKITKSKNSWWLGADGSHL
jgi:hypothetical protein